ncbi:hypothetical protein OUZ56_018648 [Daphnia magna]|uniref:Uncharacterized protein n=1 Tax=Daphnia magna TaxID=35525 RepID=A0ABQ9Z9H0_9CRUS|nr:hypothetical protein OUZ56_018648 [Daphnia magna]
MLASTAKICRFFKPVDFQHSDNFEIDDEFSDLDSELEQDRISAPMLSTTELSIDIAVSSSEESSEKFCDTMKDKRIPVPEIPDSLEEADFVHTSTVNFSTDPAYWDKTNRSLIAFLVSNEIKSKEPNKDVLQKIVNNEEHFRD